MKNRPRGGRVSARHALRQGRRILKGSRPSALIGGFVLSAGVDWGPAGCFRRFPHPGGFVVAFSPPTTGTRGDSDLTGEFLRIAPSRSAHFATALGTSVGCRPLVGFVMVVQRRPANRAKRAEDRRDGDPDGDRVPDQDVHQRRVDRRRGGEDPGGHQPGRRIDARRGRLRFEGGRRPGDRRRRAGLPRLEGRVGLRSRQSAQEDRRLDARPRRPHRPDLDAGARQAPRRGEGRGAPRGRHLRMVRGGGQTGLRANHPAG